jgi:hypothetical protein
MQFIELEDGLFVPIANITSIQFRRQDCNGLMVLVVKVNDESFLTPIDEDRYKQLMYYFKSSGKTL